MTHPRKPMVNTITFFILLQIKSVNLVLHPHGIAPTFLKLDSWSPGASFISVISTKGINQIKAIVRKKISFITIRFITSSKLWLQFHVYNKII